MPEPIQLRTIQSPRYHTQPQPADCMGLVGKLLGAYGGESMDSRQLYLTAAGALQSAAARIAVLEGEVRALRRAQDIEDSRHSLPEMG